MWFVNENSEPSNNASKVLEIEDNFNHARLYGSMNFNGTSQFMPINIYVIGYIEEHSCWMDEGA